MRISCSILKVSRCQSRSKPFLQSYFLNRLPPKVRIFMQNLGVENKHGDSGSNRTEAAHQEQLKSIENGDIGVAMNTSGSPTAMGEKDVPPGSASQIGNDYKDWSHEGLIKRVVQLERELKEKNSSVTKKIHSAATTAALEKLGKKVKQNPSRFDASKYSTRLVALKLSYLGKGFNGFEHHINHGNPVPTIEEELWKALIKARLIFPTPDEEKQGNSDGSDPSAGKALEVNWEGCEYSKCGRTDKGVSAFGQVIGIRVRSNRPLGIPKPSQDCTDEAQEGNTSKPPDIEIRAPALETDSTSILPQSTSSTLDDPELDYSSALDFDPIKDEIPYASVLNRILPPSIRILAWCPSPPLDFSARFSCRERQYRYFFTQPAFCPSPLPHHPISSQLPASASINQNSISNAHKGIPDGWLDIEAMRTAAKYYEGSNDFRNFCKIDGGKQITNFEREIFKADIEEVKPGEMGPGFAFQDGFLPSFMAQSHSKSGDLSVEVDRNKSEHPIETAKVYTFTLHGSAFLWHQVRHMVAVLFLVGQGLEEPSLVKTLLDVSQTPTRPRYEMASDTPLVLWDCIFPKSGDIERKDAMQWLYVGDDVQERKWAGNGALMEDMWKVWREKKVDEVLAGALMSVIAKQGVHGSGSANSRQNVSNGDDPNIAGKKRKSPSQKIFDGSNHAKLVGKYTPVMKKERLDSAEVTNDRYAKRKGYAGSEEMREALSGARRLALEAKSGAGSDSMDGKASEGI